MGRSLEWVPASHIDRLLEGIRSEEIGTDLRLEGVERLRAIAGILEVEIAHLREEDREHRPEETALL